MHTPYSRYFLCFKLKVFILDRLIADLKELPTLKNTVLLPRAKIATYLFIV